jgi:hypothetical protein
VSDSLSILRILGNGYFKCHNHFVQALNLAMRPAWYPILSTNLLENSGTNSKLLSHVVDGQVEVLGESFKTNSLGQRHLSKSIVRQLSRGQRLGAEP